VTGVLMRIHVRDGALVKEGELLAEIDNAMYQAEVKKAQANLARANADVTSAKAQLRLAEVELQRVEAARKGGAAGQGDLERAKAAFDVGRGQLDAAAANKDAADAELHVATLRLRDTQIRSPIAGRVGQFAVTDGNLVLAGNADPTHIVTVIAADPIHVYADLDEATTLRLRRAGAKPDAIAVEVGFLGDEGYPHRGKIDFVGNEIDPKTGTVRIRAVLPNPKDEIVPGQSARVRLSPSPK
jgi:multidrug efflux system membrane fusion protein